MTTLDLTTAQMEAAIRTLIVDEYAAGRIGSLIWEAEEGLYGNAILTAQIRGRRFQIHGGQVASSDNERTQFVQNVAAALKCRPVFSEVLNRIGA